MLKYEQGITVWIKLHKMLKGVLCANIVTVRLPLLDMRSAKLTPIEIN